VVEQGLVQLRRSAGAGQLWEARRGATYSEPLRAPDLVRGRGGQEGGPVLSLGCLNGFKGGSSGGSCRVKEGGIKSVSLRGAEGGVIGFPKLSQELCPPRFRAESYRLRGGMEGKLGGYFVQVRFEPCVQRFRGGKGRSRGD